MSRWRGFTLVELLVCVAILALLSLFAVPGWRSAGYTARRAEAREALFRLQAQQERHRFDVGEYARSLAALEQPPVLHSAAGLYMLSLEGDGGTWRASARPAPDGPQAGDRHCLELTLDDAGRRDARGLGADAPALCWGERR